MTRVHVYGASGYAGLEAVRLILAHPELHLGAVESRSHSGEALGAHAPLLRDCARTFDGPGSVLAALAPSDCVITAGAHGAARAVVPSFLQLGARVVDVSADYRADDDAVYGFAPLFREAIVSARLVANPGCYPTATLLATLPLAPFSPSTIVVDAKSGITGAGRTPAISSLFCEVYGDVRAYGLEGHRHEAEIERGWQRAGISASLHFTPHVVPIARGMLVDAYAICTGDIAFADAADAFARFYAGDPFVRVIDRAPSLPALSGTNDAEIHVSVKGNVVRVLCGIDNLGKGAAAQAVANINIMYGYPEELGLAHSAIAC